jgi:hypothetical protein
MGPGARVLEESNEQQDAHAVLPRLSNSHVVSETTAVSRRQLQTEMEETLQRRKSTELIDVIGIRELIRSAMPTLPERCAEGDMPGEHV